MTRICLVAGARPNFMKVAPVINALRERGHADWFLVHTGQHYDEALSDVFFRELRMPEPDVWLGVGSGTHAEQTGRVMIGMEKVIAERRPDLMVVVGDVNSTMAAAIVAAKANVRLAHIEAGLRSRDRTMPEEINRIVTDALADLLFTPSLDGDANLLAEGAAPEKIHFVGNVMVDSLVTHLPLARARDTVDRLGLTPSKFAVLTLHRPANVDNPGAFAGLMQAVDYVAKQMPVVFPVHPRTAQRVRDMPSLSGDIRVIEPLGYLDFLALTSRAALVITDSGGLQEETTVLGIPCLTVRENTERPATIIHGTNVLAGTSTESVIDAARKVMSSPVRAAAIPALWDGHASERIVDILLRGQDRS